MISLTGAEVERRFSLLGISNRFTKNELEMDDTMHVIHGVAGTVAFPIPEQNEGLNLLTLRKICGTDPGRPPSFFDHPWYLEEPFAQQDCAPGWRVLYTDVLGETLNRPMNYEDSLGERGLALPSAIEVALMLFLVYVGEGRQLLHKKHTWCRDEASLDRLVTLGAFGRNGLFVSAHPKEFASRGLGICAKVIASPNQLSG